MTITNNLRKTHTWQTALINTVTQPQELFELLELDPALLNQAIEATQLFPLKVTHSFIARMKKRDLNDPLLRQVLPIHEEWAITPGYSTDPLQEANANLIPGLLHKYHGRVLLLVTGNCGINCRFCFRRHFPYQDNTGWKQALTYIEQNKTISEVILSGGDPLIANDTTLKNLAMQLAEITHVKRLRIHTRMPIILPERITTEMIDWMTQTRLKTILVVHCNHPQEINHEVKHAMQCLQKEKVTLLNQSVLLKGINDSTEILVQLSETLFECGILPYYLHLNDKVQGTAHFDIALRDAQKLHRGLTEHLPGYLVPKLVCEQPGAPAKIWVHSTDFCTG